MAPVKLVPVMVTVVPPAVGPEVGETAVTVGVSRDVGELVSASPPHWSQPGVVT